MGHESTIAITCSATTGTYVDIILIMFTLPMDARTLVEPLTLPAVWRSAQESTQRADQRDPNDLREGGAGIV